MGLLLFEGAAGTGKTTRVLAAARGHVEESPLDEEQKVLGLTKYHGSRWRMEAALKGPKGVGRAVDCLTLDSFAWHLVRRWRSLARDLGIAVRQGDFQATSSAASRLLKEPEVGPWIARRYPLLVVDEMQDCKESTEVDLLGNLAPHLDCICAADAFQELSGDRDNPAISWAESVGEVERLECCHRTHREGLLAAANALRTGRPVQSDRETGFEVVSAPRAPAGGGRVSWRLLVWSKYKVTAIISPRAAGTSPFVTELLTWVEENEAQSSRSNRTAGPFKVPWESRETDLCDQLRSALDLPDDPQSRVPCADLAIAARNTKAHDVGDWIRKQQTVAGRSSLLAGEVAEEIERIVHRRRAFGPRPLGGRFASTVHQAKNREFDAVIVLWPLAIRSDVKQQRRLLYNAVTRARHEALVVVQDPKGDRLEDPVFAGCSE